ncbi:MAG: anhydro-N-acetylmuramic acid kinase [Thermodesulfobacteriota bacterium]
MNWLNSIITKKDRVVVGLMSGTSMDGIDAALVRIDGCGLDSKIELIDFVTYPYSNRIRYELEEVLNSSVAKLSDLNFAVGEAFSDAAISIIERAEFNPAEVDLVGTHGQTVFHNPPSKQSEYSSTLQIGEPDIIAERTGITTVSDFRPRDMSSNGEGAPLVPFVDYILFRNTDKIRIAQNIGGISNCTIVTPDLADVVAFDSGPGNILIDGIIKIHSGGKENFDNNGEIAKKGEVDYKLLYNLLNNDYFKESPPKTTGREMFGKNESEKLYKLVENNSLNLADMLATLVQFTVDTIYNSYEDYIFSKLKIDEVILSGGGSFNPIIVEKLSQKLNPIELSLSDKYNIPADSKEAISFAVLANETIFGNPSNLPNVTGARCGSPLGKISIGKNNLGK